MGLRILRVFKSLDDKEIDLIHRLGKVRDSDDIQIDAFSELSDLFNFKDEDNRIF